MSKKDFFNDPKLIAFMEKQVVEGWKETLDGFRDDTMFIPQFKEAYYVTNSEDNLKHLIAKFEEKYGRKLKYRLIGEHSMFYISYIETELGPEYDRTILNKHLENRPQ